MQEQGRAGVKEHTRQNRYPRERNQIYGQIEPQGQTCKRNHYEHLQRKEKHRRCGPQIGTAEHIQVHHKQTQEQQHQHRLTKDRQRPLFVTQRLIVIRPAERLENLVCTLGHHFTLVYNLLPFLHQPHRRRKSRQQFGAHVFRSHGVQHQIDRAVVIEFLMRGHRRIHLRQRVFLLL